MSLDYLGEVTIGAAIPGVLTPLLTAMGDIQARIDAMLSFSASISLDISQLIVLNASVAASLETALHAGLNAPSIDLQIKLVADALLILKAQLQIILDLISLFATAGVHLYAYDGAASGLGGALTTELSSGFPDGSGAAAHCNALILATTLSATWGVMGQILKVTA